jgi:hypothetical protein
MGEHKRHIAERLGDGLVYKGGTDQLVHGPALTLNVFRHFSILDRIQSGGVPAYRNGPRGIYHHCLQSEELGSGHAQCAVADQIFGQAGRVRGSCLGALTGRLSGGRANPTYPTASFTCDGLAWSR